MSRDRTILWFRSRLFFGLSIIAATVGPLHLTWLSSSRADVLFLDQSVLSLCVRDNDIPIRFSGTERQTSFRRKISRSVKHEITLPYKTRQDCLARSLPVSTNSNLFGTALDVQGTWGKIGHLGVRAETVDYWSISRMTGSDFHEVRTTLKRNTAMGKNCHRLIGSFRQWNMEERLWHLHRRRR